MSSLCTAHADDGTKILNIQNELGKPHIKKCSLREDGNSITSPSISSTDERRTSCPFRVNPLVETSYREVCELNGKGA